MIVLVGLGLCAFVAFIVWVNIREYSEMKRRALLSADERKELTTEDAELAMENYWP